MSESHTAKHADRSVESPHAPEVDAVQKPAGDSAATGASLTPGPSKPAGLGWGARLPPTGSRSPVLPPAHSPGPFGVQALEPPPPPADAPPQKTEPEGATSTGSADEAQDIERALLGEPGHAQLGLQLPRETIGKSIEPSAVLRMFKVDTAGKLEALASKVRYASEMLALCDWFITAEDLPDKEKQKVSEMRRTWQVRAEKQLVRLGDEWVTADVWLQRKKEALSASQVAWRMLESSGNLQAAVR